MSVLVCCCTFFAASAYIQDNEANCGDNHDGWPPWRGYERRGRRSVAIRGFLSRRRLARKREALECCSPSSTICLFAGSPPPPDTPTRSFVCRSTFVCNILPRFHLLSWPTESAPPLSTLLQLTTPPPLPSADHRKNHRSCPSKETRSRQRPYLPRHQPSPRTILAALLPHHRPFTLSASIAQTALPSPIHTA